MSPFREEVDLYLVRIATFHVEIRKAWRSSPLRNVHIYSRDCFVYPLVFFLMPLRRSEVVSALNER